MAGNSGAGACRVTASGARQYGVTEVVDLISRFPGIDAFTAAWVLAGGDYDAASGVISGATRPMGLEDFARTLKVQARVQEALKRGKVVVSAHRRVLREIETAGYCLPGVEVSPLVAAKVAAVPVTPARVASVPMPSSLWDAVL